ncbi:NUDIX hydrolase [Streptomyces reticuliscabiei]|uniref:NUDIX hydrolase n=1 Tax=Streptomyces reticuliscabiei TaxID=146821 RepID=UPI0015C509BB|nr:NUDIX domain-containing protein [Streptomyces reticuliscabiei]
MGIPAPHIQDVVTAYLCRHPEEQELLRPLLDRIEAGHDLTRRTEFGGHVTTSGVVVNDADEVLLVLHRASGRRIQPGGHCEPSDSTLSDAVRREIAEETGVTELELCCGGDPIQIDVHTIEARPTKGEPAHRHFDIRFLFRIRGAIEVTLQAEEVAGAEWCGPSQLGDPVLRARVLAALGRPQPDRPTDDDPYGTLVVITNAAGEVLMHLRDMKEGIWAPGTWTPMGGGAEPQDADPHGTGERELHEEVGLQGVELTRMFSVDSDGYPVHVFHGRWDGDPESLVLTEGTALAFIAPADFDRLPMNTSVKADTRRVLDLVTARPAPYGYGTLALICNTAGHLLMHRRDDTASCWPDTWSPNGGKPEAEDAGPVATIRREVREEIGLDVPLEHLLTHTTADGHLTYVFRGRWDGDPESLVLTEGTALAFVDPTDMRGLPMSPLARYAALSGLSADLEEQARADGIRELVAAGIIVHDGAFLVVRRNPDDYLGGTWEIPAGQREKNESVLDSLLRAVVDETGLAVRSVDRYVGHVDYTNARGGTSRQYIFTITPEKPGPIALTEHDRHQWVRGTDDLPSTTKELRAFLDSREPLS